MSTLQREMWLAMGILMCVPGVWAQSQSQDQGQSQSQSQDQSQAPIPAVHPPITAVGTDSEDVEPDTQPLAGAQALSLGLTESHSYWEPRANIISTATSNGLAGNQGWTSFSTLLGGVNLHYLNGRSDLALDYQGGGVVSNDGTVANSVVQELGLVEHLYLRRSTLSFIDRTSYLPESAFGYAGLNLGTGLSLQPGLTPNGTILTTQVRQIDNTSLATIDTKLNPRSSITLMGGYSLLHFFGSNLIDSNATIVQAGYNRDITGKNSIAVIYRFKAFRFSNSAQSINDSLVHLSFARRVTGRMSFQVQAGPEYATFGTPILTGSGSQGPTESSRLSWSLASALTYRLERAQLNLTYNHGIVGGGGVFAGSVGDTVRGGVSHDLTQTLNGLLSVGYGRNRNLAAPGSANPSEVFNNLYGVLGVSRRFGRMLRVNLSYEAQYQNSNFSFCAGPACGDSILVHRVFLGLNWQGGPHGF